MEMSMRGLDPQLPEDLNVLSKMIKMHGTAREAGPLASTGPGLEPIQGFQEPKSAHGQIL